MNARVLRQLGHSAVRRAGVVAASLVVRWLQLSRRQVGVVLAYHGVEQAPASAGCTLLVPHPAALFEAQMRVLASQHRVVPACELLSAVQQRRRGERFPVAVTLDDDLTCHATVAMPILRRLQVNATFFLSGASLEGPFAFWWERLQRALALEAPRLAEVMQTPMTPAAALQLCQQIEAATPEARDEIAELLSEIAGPDPSDAGLRSDEVRILVDAGMHVGFHTLRHDPLPPLSDADLARSMVVGREPLESVTHTCLDVIAYPHGVADARVVDAARHAGYRVGFVLNQETVHSTDDPLLLSRRSPTYRSPGHFALNLAYWLATGRPEKRRSLLTRLRRPGHAVQA